MASPVSGSTDPQASTLRIALLLSLALHAALLLLAYPAAPNRPSGQPVLTVELESAVTAASRSRLQQQAHKSRRPPESTPVLTQAGVSPVAISPPNQPQPRPTPETPAARVTSKPATGSQTGQHKAAGTATRVTLRPGEVAVVMLMDKDGRPGQILWDKLPALTEAQLLRVEAAIREMRFPETHTGQVRTETIDVLRLLAQISRPPPAQVNPESDVTRPEPATGQ
ncbi:MAG: hypothetical protein JSR19_13085 [Proteobacteria bacterium]|nr:hypothetical protein [Pseudomonadota bacterium]HQR03441.1 hypothetical protein [Rhodocyclaceae bacterium]